MDDCTCSNEPIISVTLVARLMTGLTILAGLENRNRPGYWPCFSMGIRPISNVSGTCTQQTRTQSHGTIFYVTPCTFSCPNVLSVLSFVASSSALSASTSPMSRPSSTTDKWAESDGRGPPRGFIPREVRSRGRWVELGVAVVTRQAAARWLSSPQGAPSGV